MPYKIDLFAVFILLGIVQAIFLSWFFLSGENRKNAANVFHGAMLLSMAACIFEIFVMYTGYIQQCFFLVDFSEPLSFVIGPCFYLIVYSMIHGKVKRAQYFHFVFPVVYLIMIIPFFILPEDAKYNAWIGSYHPGLPYRDLDFDDDVRNLITNNHTEVSLASLLLYTMLSVLEIARAFRAKKEFFWSPVHPLLKRFRVDVILIFSVTVIILLVKFFNVDDTGDHILAAYISLVIYYTSFQVISNSNFFRTTTLADQQKSKAVPVPDETKKLIVEKLNRVMREEKPFLKPDFSLPDLAQQLSTPVHVLSFVINDGLGKSFFEMMAEHRIEEAKQLLKEKTNIKVEEIAGQVGYNSKSSFNTAFKKLTGKTPSEYRSTQG